MSRIDSLNSIMNNYLEKNPSCRLMPKDKLVEKMVTDGIITREQANQILNSLSVFGKGFNSTPTDPLQIFGFYKINKTDNNNNNSILPFINVDSNGKVDVNQFTIENFEKKFASYKNVEIYSENKNENYDRFFIDIDNVPVMSILQNDIENTFIINYMNVSVLGNSNSTSVLIDNGELRTISKNGAEYYYSSGECYKKIENNGESKNYLVEDLIADIYAKNSLGFPTTRESISHNVLDRITEYNVFNILSTYEEISGNSLLKDISNEWGLKNDLKEKLLNHIIFVMRKNKDSEKSEYLANLIADEIYGIPSGNLEIYISLLDSDNILDVLKSYKDATKSKVGVGEKLNDILDIIEFTSLFNYFLGKFVDNYIPEDFIYDCLAPCEMLISAIDNENFSISEEKRKEMIDYIINCVKLSQNNNSGTEDIIRDIEVHPNNSKKLDIDLGRLLNRNYMNFGVFFEKANGKFDVPTQQGNTGDCWLLAGIISMLRTVQGQKYLESCLSVNEKTGDVTVNLKGVGVTYVIPAKDIENSNHLVAGDGDIRAIELAIDRYFKEAAYAVYDGKDIDSLHIDIKGNFVKTFYKLFLGNGEIKEWNDYTDKDFNDKNKLYALSFNESAIEKLSSSKSKLFYISDKLIPNHAYTILYSDEEYVYLVNPHGLKTTDHLGNSINVREDWCNTKPIKIKKCILNTINPDIEEANLQ